VPGTECTPSVPRVPPQRRCERFFRSGIRSVAKMREVAPGQIAPISARRRQCRIKFLGRQEEKVSVMTYCHFAKATSPRDQPPAKADMSDACRLVKNRPSATDPSDLTKNLRLSYQPSEHSSRKLNASLRSKENSGIIASRCSPCGQPSAG